MGAHPQGFTPPEKEVRYFTVHHDRGQDWYRSRFAAAAAGEVGCDATPGYLYSDVALERIAAEMPTARLVVVLREPAARIWSHWCYNVAMGIEPRSLVAALTAELADARVTPPGLPIGYLAGSRYHERLDAVLARFRPEQLLVLFTDELRDSPAGAFAQMCRHGGIADDVTPSHPAYNEGRWPRSRRLQRALLLARAGSWPAGVGSRLVKANLRPGPPPALDPRRRDWLRSLTADELPALADQLGRGLPVGWTSSAAAAAPDGG